MPLAKHCSLFSPASKDEAEGFQGSFGRGNSRCMREGGDALFVGVLARLRKAGNLLDVLAFRSYR